MASAVASSSAGASASGSRSSSPAKAGALAQDTGAAGAGGGTDGNATIRPKKRGKANALLRDYYGLGGGGLSTANEDPTDPDSSSFDKQAAYKAVLSSSTLPQVLKRETDLLTEIRDLDGERQSLVYNHHHELIAASETIRKMKQRAESMDASLEALRTSFSNISQLTSDLSAPASKEVDSATRSAGEGPNEGQESSTAGKASSSNKSDGLDVRLPNGKLIRIPHDVRRELLSIANLPTRLRETLALHSAYSQRNVTPEALASAEKMWGRTEPTIAKWVEEGFADAKIIAAECRTILREAQAELDRSGGGSAPAAGREGNGSVTVS